MIKLLLWALYALAVAVAFDLLGRRLAARGECALHRALILPNSCRGDCPPGQRCSAFVTRPHWLGGREAVGCGCAENRLGGGPTDPPDFATLPKPRDETPERPPQPLPAPQDA